MCSTRTRSRPCATSRWESRRADVEVLAGLQEWRRLVAKPGELDLNGKRIEAQQ